MPRSKKGKERVEISDLYYLSLSIYSCGSYISSQPILSNEKKQPYTTAHVFSATTYEC
jgi:hypothetical protein